MQLVPAREQGNESAPAAVPSSIISDRYRLGSEVLGIGTWAEVKIGTDLETNSPVAIKVVQKDKLNDNDRALIQQEMQVMRTLEHPHVIKLRHTAEDDQFIYIVMEYVEGGDLLSYLTRRPNNRVSEGTARRLFAQLLSAVEYLHASSIAHRDLKLENILVDETCNRIVVIDFGLCGLMNKNRPMTVYCGSPAYAAPELIQRIPYNGCASDTWSLGIVLYALVVGDYPFNGDDINTLYRQILQKTPTFPSHVSTNARHLILRMLAKNPGERITTAEIHRHPWMLMPATSSQPQKKKAYDLLVARDHWTQSM
jgi:serine/threonine protein kinase